MRPQQCTLRALFDSWKHAIIFDKLHKFIRQQNHINRKNRLEIFLKESVPLVLQNQMHESYKRIRTFVSQVAAPSHPNV